MNKLIISEYVVWFKELKEKVRKAQVKAGLAVNTVLLELYWEIGKEIVKKQKISH